MEPNLYGWRRADEEAGFLRDALAFYLKRYGQGFQQRECRQRVDGGGRRVGMDRNTDSAGTGSPGTGYIRVCMGRFDPYHQENQENTGLCRPALQAALPELAFPDHRLLSATKYSTMQEARARSPHLNRQITSGLARKWGCSLRPRKYSRCNTLGYDDCSRALGARPTWAQIGGRDAAVLAS
jgi:hypothetical protein